MFQEEHRDPAGVDDPRGLHGYIQVRHTAGRGETNLRNAAFGICFGFKETFLQASFIKALN